MGNNNGAIDPGEPIKLTVQLLNPWHNTAFNVPSATATLTSSTPGVTITDNSSTYPAIPAQGTVNGDTFAFTLATSVTCGQSLHFTLTTTSALGITSFDFVLRVGDPTGPGTPVTYTRTIPNGLNIPDDDFNGVSDSFAITDDLEINDLQFRVDSLTHTFTGDLTVELKAPNGYGTDLIYVRGFFIGDGDGDNFTNTVIDEAAVDDLNLTGEVDAPYTGSWTPAFNSAIWSLFGIPNLGPDPIGQLATRLAGQSTQGTWRVHVTDEAFLDTGKLNSWSLIVTPTAFACTVFQPAQTVNVTGTKTATGNFQVGGTIIYTVTLTNSGTAAQTDNPGNEFTDVLPATVTLVSASASSGTAVATVGTNTVTWNGTIAPSGGTVTINIQATINQGTTGQTISNQGTFAFDSDGNGTNDTSGVTDDPGTQVAGDTTAITVSPSIAEVPTLSDFGLATLVLALAGAALLLMRRRRTA